MKVRIEFDTAVSPARCVVCHDGHPIGLIEHLLLSISGDLGSVYKVAKMDHDKAAACIPQRPNKETHLFLEEGFVSIAGEPLCPLTQDIPEPKETDGL